MEAFVKSFRFGCWFLVLLHSCVLRGQTRTVMALSHKLFHAAPSSGQFPNSAAHPREIPPPTPVKFPSCLPNSRDKSSYGQPLVNFLRTIQRPADVKIEHLEALGLHVIVDAPPSDLIPESEYLPPSSWMSASPDSVEALDAASTRPLNNGRNSPGAKTYVERVKELSVPNLAAIRTIRRLPAPAGETNPRLGNAYEFFRNLEMMSTFWDDTSLPSHNPDSMDIDSEQPLPSDPPKDQEQASNRTGAGSQTPPDFRQALLSALVKLVAYDFGCNVSLPRVEPRLYISPPRTTPNPNNKSTAAPAPTSSFPTNLSFIYRTPTTRSAARSGIVEGPLAALSWRQSTVFPNELDHILDLCREIIAVLVTAQQRARENKEEVKQGDDVWWCHKPRWGGGSGGPIGREADKLEAYGAGEEIAVEGVKEAGSMPERLGSEVKSPTGRKGRKTMTMYDNYRMIRPPSSTWDRKAKYLSIGKPTGAPFDDIFLLSALNHHVSVVRVRVPTSLLDELEGGEMRDGGREECTMWRSKWYDMFLVEDRVEAMGCLWGMMGYLMRKVDSGTGTGQ